MSAFLTKQHARFSDFLDCECAPFIATVLMHQNGGYADKRSAYQLALRDLNQSENILDRIVSDFEVEYGTEAVIFEGVMETLRALAERCSLGLISNGRSEGQRKKLSSTGIARFFDAVVISEEVGVKKPNPLIFEACLEALRIYPNEAAYVGDNPSNDIEPAMNLGMKAIWLKNDQFDPPIKVDAILSDIADLPNALMECRLASSLKCNTD